jgi:hypothetical protein
MKKKGEFFDAILEHKKCNPGFSKTRETKRLSKMKKSEVIEEYEKVVAAASVEGNAAPTRLKWDEFMVETLLNLRLVKFGNTLGKKNTSNQQRGVYWSKLELEFNQSMVNEKNDTRLTSKQLQEKYTNLKVSQLL